MSIKTVTLIELKLYKNKLEICELTQLESCQFKIYNSTYKKTSSQKVTRID